jgi:hypothetical protein
LTRASAAASLACVSFIQLATRTGPPCFDCCPVLAQLGVAFGNLALRGLIRLHLAGLGGFEFLHGRWECDRIELCGQPLIELRKQLLFAQVHR